MTKFAVTLIVALITISQASAQLTSIIHSARTISPIESSQPTEANLNPTSTEATLTSGITLTQDGSVPTETVLPTETILPTEPTLFTEATLSRDTTLPTEKTLNTEAILSTDSTPFEETTSSIPVVTSSLPVTPSTETTANSAQCLTPLGKDGSCVSLHQCASVLNLIRKQPLLEEDKLYLKASQCGYKNRIVLVCCPDQQENAVNAPSVSDSPKLALIPGRGKCGIMSTNRLYGGYSTEFDAYTWSALLEYKKGDNGTGHHCGGTLINNRYVLTAAHCVIGFPSTWTLSRVRLGEWDTASDNDCTKFSYFEDCPDPYVDVPIERIIAHEKYVPKARNLLHDIALIRLANTVTSTDFIQPACLPLGENMRQAFHNQSLDLVGWGASPEGYWNSEKQRASAQVISLGDCREFYAKFDVELQDTQFCVTGRLRNDTCRTDSGGAAVGFDTANRGLGAFHIAGIQSFGPCWLDGYPSVFTRVSEYLDWILENIQA